MIRRRHVRGSARKPFPGIASVLFLSAALALLAGAAAAQESAALEGAEYRVKAAFVYHFVRFTQWPARAFPREDSPLVVCVAGEPAGVEALFTLRDKRVRGRRILVRRFDDGTAEDCHVLFVGVTAPDAVAGLLRETRGRGVLTVGESGAFVRECGIISFFLENEHLRFAVNLAAAARSGIRFSSQLLMSAEILEDPEGCPRPEGE